MDITVGFIGCGSAVQTAYAPACAVHSCTPAAWYDPVEERAEKLARTYGGQVFQSMDALLAARVRAVMIDLPIALRAPAICAALKAGCYVLCELPLTMDFDGVWALIVATLDAPGRLMAAGAPRFSVLKNSPGGVGGPQPSDCNLNPATCAGGSEALRSKVSLQDSPAAPQAQVNPVSAEKIAQRAFSTVWAADTPRLSPAPEALCAIGAVQSFEASYSCPRPVHAASAMESLAAAAIGALHTLLGVPFTDVCAMESPNQTDAHLLLCTDSRITGQLHVGWHGREGGHIRVYGGEGTADFSLEAVSLREHADAFLHALQTGASLPENVQTLLAAHQVALLARRSATEGKRLYVRLD
ncbi:MAG: Gfo/Idh/MocA family oxidoreductase [Clostridiales bacterium]|nr:Gfo/Idh/MocA family oxidoreductase [Clostridiales bacterium]